MSDDDKITKLSQYMEFVENLPIEFSLSRGQAGDYPLLPSALRLEDGKRKYTKRAINSFLINFKINSYQYMSNPWDIKNDIEWMLYAQHYGIPTKLMDFTSSHLASLLFSVEKAFSDSEEKDAVVYFLNPIALNNKNKQQSKIITVDENFKFSSDDHEGPYVIQTRKINPRINAQNGLFVFFQDDDISLENSVGNDILIKKVINGSDKRQILSSLYSMGANFTSIYPELSSVAKDIITQEDIIEFEREIA